jgi:hypothetical protein
MGHQGGVVHKEAATKARRGEQSLDTMLQLVERGEATAPHREHFSQPVRRSEKRLDSP